MLTMMGFARKSSLHTRVVDNPRHGGGNIRVRKERMKHGCGVCDRGDELKLRASQLNVYRIYSIKTSPPFIMHAPVVSFLRPFMHVVPPSERAASSSLFRQPCTIDSTDRLGDHM